MYIIIRIMSSSNLDFIKIIFDELSQFVIKEITEQQVKGHNIYNLEKYKKYLITYFDDDNIISCIQFAGYFYKHDNSYNPGLGMTESYDFASTESGETSANVIIYSDLNSNFQEFINYTKIIFYELEYNFNYDNITNIFNLIKNNLSDDLDLTSQFTNQIGFVKNKTWKNFIGYYLIYNKNKLKEESDNENDNNNDYDNDNNWDSFCKSMNYINMN